MKNWMWYWLVPIFTVVPGSEMLTEPISYPYHDGARFIIGSGMSVFFAWCCGLFDRSDD